MPDNVVSLIPTGVGAMTLPSTHERPNDDLREGRHQTMNDLSVALAFLDCLPHLVPLDAEMDQEREEAITHLTRAALWLQRLKLQSM